METYHKIQTLFKRDMDGSITGQRGRMLRDQWSTPELEYLRHNEWEWTEKIDGTNIRIGHHMDGEVVQFGGRTDRAVIPSPLLAHLQETFTAELFESAGFDGPVILFGEGYGPSIQGGGSYRQDHSFILFDVKIGDWWLHRKDVDDIAHKLGIRSVPVIGHGTLYDAIDLVTKGLPSHIGRTHNAEGLVARPSVPMLDRKGRRVICKVKEVDFR